MKELLGLKGNKKYVLLRFVAWNAHHDIGHSGLSIEMKFKAVKEFSKYAQVFISSEKELPDDLPHIFISSIAQIGISELKDALWKMLN